MLLRDLRRLLRLRQQDAGGVSRHPAGGADVPEDGGLEKAWDEGVAASKAQEAKPMHGGWIGEPCAQVEARPGCCCFPKLHPTATERVDCKPSMTEFDCRAECSMFKDGRLPSGCTWAAGGCQP
jgi:hypothetical protein